MALCGGETPKSRVALEGEGLAGPRLDGVGPNVGPNVVPAGGGRELNTVDGGPGHPFSHVFPAKLSAILSPANLQGLLTLLLIEIE